MSVTLQQAAGSASPYSFAAASSGWARKALLAKSAGIAATGKQRRRMTETSLSYELVDQMEDPSLCIGLMDRMRDAPDIQAIRTDVKELLHPEPGQRILDLGCGTGDLSRDMAAYVAPGGEVIGVDFSRAMVDEAIRRQVDPDLPVTFEHGDAQALRFKSGSFDRCWTERMLCHLSNPAAALAEMVRVVRPGGLVAVVDIDAGGTMIDHPDQPITVAFLDAMWAQSKTPWVGRQFRRLLTEAGLVDVVLRPKVVEISYTMLEPIMGPIGRAVVAAGSISSEAFASWTQDLADADADGIFFMALTIVIAAATKP
jgi:ubiquinone/menaquinone biosynthesis C-methylase UbiE